MQHVVECLVDRGIKAIDILLHHDADKIEAYFQDGQRWGATFTYHIVRDTGKLNDRVERIVSRYPEDEPAFLFVHADRLEPNKWLEVEPNGSSCPIVFCYESDGSNGDEPTNSNNPTTTWAGAAWLTPDCFRTIRKQIALGVDFATAACDITRDAGTLIEVSKPLDGRTFRSLIESQSRVLSREFPELIRFPGPAEEMIWIQRNVVMHRDVQFIPPVYIGPNSEIEGNVVLGPNVVISSDCHIQSKCEVTASLISKSSLLGEGLAVDDCVIDRHQLYHIKHDVAVAINDDLLIGSTTLTIPGLRQIRRCASRLVALIVLVAAWPLLVAVAALQKLRCGKGFYFEEVVRLPVPSDRKVETFQRLLIGSRRPKNESNFRHLLLHLLPGMYNVLRGEMGWVGVTPMSPKRLELLPKEWREPYAKCEGGLINEATVLHGDRELNDEVLSAEVIHAVTIKTFAQRIKTISRYFMTLFTGPKSLGNQASRLPTAGAGAMFR